MLFPALAVSLSASFFTKSAFGITTVLPSGVVTVAFPLSSTTTVESGFTASTAALIASLASVGKSLSAATSAGSTTTLSAGLFTASCFAGSAKSALGFTKSLAGIVAVFGCSPDAAGVVTVAFPFSSNTTSAPGFTAWILALIASFSGSVNAAGFSTTTLSAGVFTWFPPVTLSLSASDLTKSATGIVAVLPSLVVTVAFPLSSTTTVASGFTASTAALILAISGSVNCVLSATRTLSAGLLILLPAFGVVFSSAPLTKSSASITAVFPSGVVTVASPFSLTVITEPSGLTAAIFALIASRSGSVKAFLSATTVCEFGLLMSSPPFAFLASSGVLNKSAAGIVAIVPSLRTTVAFPSASYLTVASAPFNFFSFAVAFSWSAGFVALPTTLSAGLRIPALPEPSFPASANVRTNSLAGKPAVCPSGVETVTVPAASIVTTALGLTSRTAFLIFSLSSGVNSSGLLTITLSVGRLILFPPPVVSKALASFVKSTCFNVSVLPFGNVTLALPS